MIKVEHLYKTYDRKNVLKDISLQVHPGEMVGLLGPSGSGKTTLIKHLVGALEAEQGSVFIQGHKMPDLGVFSEIGYMAQEDALYEELSAGENLSYFGMLYGLGAHRLRGRIRELLKSVSLGAEESKEVRKFSGGMKRRLTLAIAMIHEPNLLILDEPTVGIDPLLRRDIWQELRRRNEQGVTILVTTHVMAEVENCDRIAMIREGELMAFDTADALMRASDTSSLQEAFLYFAGQQHAH